MTMIWHKACAFELTFILRLMPDAYYNRPRNPVGILFGYDNGLLIPTGGAERDGERVGDLLCYRTMLGSGQVLAGFNVDIVWDTLGDDKSLTLTLY